jgi:hypothetical protein
VGDAPPEAKQTPGLYRTSDGTAAGRLVAVNVDAKESDPARLSVDEFQAAVTRLKDVSQSTARLENREHEDRQRLWQYVLVLMIAALVTESWIARRTA